MPYFSFRYTDNYFFLNTIYDSAKAVDAAIRHQTFDIKHESFLGDNGQAGVSA